MNSNLTKYLPGFISATAAVALLVLFIFFPVLEPMMATSATSQFTVSQSVTAELAITTAPTNVTMSPSLAGITGGSSYGYTYVIVTTNNTTGYSMTLHFSSTTAMNGNTTGGTIPNYVPSVTDVPDYTFTVAANRAGFGYTASASTTADLDANFKDNASNACNTGSADTGGMTQGSETCWLNPSTTPQTIVNRSSYTPASGATTSLKFKITINSSPSPMILADTYVATSTITATAN